MTHSSAASSSNTDRGPAAANGPAGAGPAAAPLLLDSAPGASCECAQVSSGIVPNGTSHVMTEGAPIHAQQQPPQRPSSTTALTTVPGCRDVIPSPICGVPPLPRASKGKKVPAALPEPPPQAADCPVKNRNAATARKQPAAAPCPASAVPDSSDEFMHTSMRQFPVCRSMIMVKPAAADGPDWKLTEHSRAAGAGDAAAAQNTATNSTDHAAGSPGDDSDTTGDQADSHRAGTNDWVASQNGSREIADRDTAGAESVNADGQCAETLPYTWSQASACRPDTQRCHSTSRKLANPWSVSAAAAEIAHKHACGEIQAHSIHRHISRFAQHDIDLCSRLPQTPHC